MKPLIAVYIVGSGYLAIAFRLSLLGHTPFDETLFPKYSIFPLKYLHFEGLSFSLEPEAFEDCSKAFDVFLLCAKVNDNVIQIDQTGQLTLLNNWSSIAGKLLECCIAQRACTHTGKIPVALE